MPNTLNKKTIGGLKNMSKEEVRLDCHHYDGDGYIYEYCEEEEKEYTLNLCSACNLNVAGEIMKQVAIATFAGDFKDGSFQKKK